MLPTQPYKGSRDFFPEEMRSRDWMFGIMTESVKSFGFEKYDAPILEPIDIYLAKTSEEIVNQQIYSFDDRGGRKVAIRPEMTPTVARMVAQKNRELPRPVKWFSIPNLCRYEKMGKGRLREHWQLNCDIFGAYDELMADLEIIQVAIELMKKFGATHEHFRVSINHRKVLTKFFDEILKLPSEKHSIVSRILDKKSKISPEAYQQMLADAQITAEQAGKIDQYLDNENGLRFLEKNIKVFDEDGRYLIRLLDLLSETGYEKFINYDPSIVRGFDYYTGIVFEIFDCHPENKRSLFGGGRYDNLITNYAKIEMNAVGFGMGDVTFVDFLKTHELYVSFQNETQVYVAIFPEENLKLAAIKLAHELRENNIKTELSFGAAKLGKQFQIADAKQIPLVVLQGAEELQKDEITVKNLQQGFQQNIKSKELIDFIKTQLLTSNKKS